MSKTKIVVTLFFVIAFTCLCETTLAKLKNNSEDDFSLRKDMRAYMSFCTGVYLMLDHRWEDAIVFFEKALQSDPNTERIHNYLATCYFQLNKKEKAMFHIEKIARLKPDDFSIHYTLGNIYQSEGNEKGALLEYERANVTKTDGIDKVFVSDMLHRLANIYMNNGDVQNAANIYKKILDLKLTDEPVKVLYRLGQIYTETDRIKEAIQEFVKAKEYNPHSEPISFYLALCYEKLEDYDNAMAELESFLEYDAEAWLMRINLSNIYEKVKLYEKAESEREKVFVILKESVEKGSQNLREYIVLSQLLQRKGQDDKAVEMLRTAVSGVITGDNDDFKEARFMLANLYYEMNDHENVVKELENVLQVDPDNHQANNFLGYYFLEKGENLDHALSLIKKALSIDPENGAYLDSLGWAYYQLADEDDDEQIKLALQKLIEASKCADDPEIVAHVGDVYYSLGFWDKAQEQWEIALKLWEQPAVADVPPYSRHETAREHKARKVIQDKLEKLRYLKVVENSMEKLKSEERVVRNNIQ